MEFYSALGYLIGYVFVFFLAIMFVAPFLITMALLNDKTYNDVKAQIDDPANPWEIITKQK